MSGSSFQLRQQQLTCAPPSDDSGSQLEIRPVEPNIRAVAPYPVSTVAYPPMASRRSVAERRARASCGVVEFAAGGAQQSVTITTSPPASAIVVVHLVSPSLHLSIYISIFRQREPPSSVFIYHLALVFSISPSAPSPRCRRQTRPPHPTSLTLQISPSPPIIHYAWLHRPVSPTVAGISGTSLQHRDHP